MMRTEDNISVGESVKMRSRLLSEEQRKASEKIRLLKEEETRIYRMKSKLERRKKKEERRKKDRERMERGNRELVMSRELFKGDESFLGVGPLVSSTQKTVMFDTELTKIRNISPDFQTNEGEAILPDVSFADADRLWFDKPDKQSQQIFLATQTLLKSKSRSSRRKAKKSLRVEIGGGDANAITPPVKGFDVKKSIEKMLFSNQLNPCEFSLPKEFTSLKLEKIRENKVLKLSLESSSPSEKNTPREKRGRPLSDDEQSSPKRKVRNSLIERKSPWKELRSKKSGFILKLENILYEKCCDGKFSVVTFIFHGSLEVWTSSLGSDHPWKRVANFTFDRKLNNPFLVVDKDTIRVKDFYVENSHIKEASFAILGENGDFSDPVTSTQNLLVLTESLNIDKLVVEKHDSRQVIIFHDVDKFTRGSVVTYIQDQMEIKTIGTIEGSTQTVKKLLGTDDISLSFINSIIYVWNISYGHCVKMIEVDLVAFDSLRVLKAVNVRGNINILHVSGEQMTISVLNKTGFQLLASTPFKKSLKCSESRAVSVFSTSNTSLSILLGNWWCSWDLAEGLAKWGKVLNIESLDKFLGLNQ